MYPFGDTYCINYPGRAAYFFPQSSYDFCLGGYFWFGRWRLHSCLAAMLAAGVRVELVSPEKYSFLMH